MAALNRKDSLSFLLLRLVAGALAAGVLFFYFLSFAGDYLVVCWYQSSDYVAVSYTHLAINLVWTGRLF